MQQFRIHTYMQALYMYSIVHGYIVYDYSGISNHIKGWGRGQWYSRQVCIQSILGGVQLCTRSTEDRMQPPARMHDVT